MQILLSRNSKHNFISCPDPKRVESYLQDTIAFSESIQYGDQVCYLCYKFFNQMLKSDVCMLSSEDIVFRVEGNERKSWKSSPWICVPNTGTYSDIVECCLYKMALYACDLVASDHQFLSGIMYRQFIEHIGDCDIDFSGVSTSKSRLLTFLGN